MIKYDEKYYFNLLKIHTHTAKQICDIRWNMVLSSDVGVILPTVLDYGSGVGWFAAFKPSTQIVVDTFDIMPVPQSGIIHDHYDIVTMWDVLEHIPDFTELSGIFSKTDFVALSIPIKPDNITWNEWKHFKPAEHLQYYSKDLLEAMFGIYGFKKIIECQIECPPRTDVWDFVFKKEGK